MDIKSPLPSLLHHNTHAPPPTFTKQPNVSKPTTDLINLFQSDTLRKMDEKENVKNSMGNQDCMTDSLCNVHRQSSDTTPSLSQNAVKKKKAYTLPPLRYGNNHKSADFAGYDDPTRTIPTDELALFMRNKKRYCPPNFKPIPPSPGGWVQPVQEIAWESTCHTDDSPFLHLRSIDGPLDLPWKKSTIVMPARYQPLLQKPRPRSVVSTDDTLRSFTFPHKNGSNDQSKQQPLAYFTPPASKDQSKQPSSYHDLSPTSQQSFGFKPSPPLPSTTSHPKQHQRASTGQHSSYFDPPPPSKQQQQQSICFHPSPPSKQQHPSYFDPPPPSKQQPHLSYYDPPPPSKQQQPRRSFNPPPPLFSMGHYKQHNPSYHAPPRSMSFDSPPWTAPPLGTFSPWDSSPPTSTWRRSMDPTPTKPSSTTEDLDLLMEDRSISILRVLDDDDPPVHHRLYYNISDYVVVSDA